MNLQRLIDAYQTMQKIHVRSVQSEDLKGTYIEGIDASDVVDAAVCMLDFIDSINMTSSTFEKGDSE